MTQEGGSHASGREWAAALAVFAAAAAALFLLAWPSGPLDLGGDQVSYLTVLKKSQEADLFQRDFALSEMRRPRLFPPLCRALMLASYRLAGDWLLATKLWLVPTALAYLVAMYVFLRAVVPSGGAAVATAVLSLPSIKTLGATFWGFGPVHQMVPRSLALPLVPLALWLFLRWETQGRVVLVFLGAGLAVSLHPPTALGVALALGLTAAMRGGLRHARWLRLAGCAAAFLAGSAPFVLRFGSALSRAGVSARQVNPVLRERFPWDFVSTMRVDFGQLGGWVLVAAAVAVLLRAKQRRLDGRDSFLGCFAVSVVVTSVGAAGAVELIGDLTGRPYFASLMRNFRLVFVAYYAYVGLLMAEAVSALRRGSLSRVLGLLMVAALTVGGIHRAGRTLRCDLLVRALRRGRHDVVARGRHRPVLDLCSHVRQHAPRDALFHIWDPEQKYLGLYFRFVAERAVTASEKDAICFRYGRKAKLVEWHRRVAKMRADYASRDTGRVVATAREFGADYVVVPAGWPPMDLPVHYDDPRGYRLYALRAGVPPSLTRSKP